MGRKLHHLTIRRGAGVLAEGEAAVDPSDPMDIQDAAEAVGKASNEPDVGGCRVQIHTLKGVWVKEVKLR